MEKNIHEEKDERFVNPYNFVPFMGTCNRSAGETAGKRYTGYLECSIKLLTPLFIPNTSSDVRLLMGSEKADPKCQKEKWRGYDFASYDDWSGEDAGGASDTTLPPPPQNPVIYASALRGALRSVHEAAFNGCMSSISRSTIEEILRRNGGYQPCDSKELCPTCRIFGMAGEKGDYAYGSKVRVTDAVLMNPPEDSEKLFEDPIILPELGEPKPEAVEFYTTPPYCLNEKPEEGNGFWTYDYKHKIVKGKVSKKKVLFEKGELKLRGRKFYWHKNVEMNKYAKPGATLSSMRQRIRPMKATSSDLGSIFCFRIYFEELNREQLRQLKWAVDFGNKDCAHKIGRAKPLGFGSVQMSVNALYLREIDVKTGEWKLEKNTEPLFAELLKENKPMRMMQIIANWKERPEGINYPLGHKKNNGNGKKGQNDTASHQWFTLNKSYIPGEPNFFKVLPKIQEDADKNLDKKKALHMLVEEKRRSNTYSSKKKF